MGGKVAQPRNPQREIPQHRWLPENKNLRPARDNWVSYRRFVAHWEDIGYKAVPAFPPPSLSGT